MKISYSLVLFALAGFLLVSHTMGVPTWDNHECTSEQASAIEEGFNNIAKDIHALNDVSSANVVSASSSPNFAASEQGLFQLSKDIDWTVERLKELDGILDTQATGAISNDLQDSVVDVRAITDTIIRMQDVWRAQGYDQVIVQILQSLAPGFAHLYDQLKDHLYADARQVVAPMILDIICLMDDAAEALQPGARLADDEYCNCYGTYKKVKPDYGSCPDKPFPTLPKTPKHWRDCSGSCSSTIKWGYENDCYKGHGACADEQWCTSVHGAQFTFCTWDWKPDHWVCS